MRLHKHYIHDLDMCKRMRNAGLLWYEDANGNDMKGVTWEPMLISPTVWRFFVWAEPEDA